MLLQLQFIQVHEIVHQFPAIACMNVSLHWGNIQMPRWAQAAQADYEFCELLSAAGAAVLLALVRLDRSSSFMSDRSCFTTLSIVRFFTKLCTSIPY